MKLGRRGTEACNSVVWFERPGRKLQALEMNCKDFFCFQNCYSDHLSLSTQNQLNLKKLSSCKTLSWLDWSGWSLHQTGLENTTQHKGLYICRVLVTLKPGLVSMLWPQPRGCDRDAIRMGVGFDLLKLAILVWFLAPFGYNASDVIFENVKTIYYLYLL